MLSTSPRRSPHFCGDSKTESPQVKRLSRNTLQSLAGTCGDSFHPLRVREFQPSHHEFRVFRAHAYMGRRVKSPRKSPQIPLCL
jgi:hypothetical protein